MERNEIIQLCIDLCNEIGEDVDNGNGLAQFFKDAQGRWGSVAYLCAERLESLKDHSVE